MVGLTGQRAQSEPRIKKASRSQPIEMSRPISKRLGRICVDQSVSAGGNRGAPH